MQGTECHNLSTQITPTPIPKKVDNDNASRDDIETNLSFLREQIYHIKCFNYNKFGHYTSHCSDDNYAKQYECIMGITGLFYSNSPIFFRNLDNFFKKPLTKKTKIKHCVKSAMATPPAILPLLMPICINNSLNL